ncbi:MAG: polysaccharide deacetylase family protein [Clostridia bacterium]|nr:polysaccharide deacetylase family protein [Bacillota bacterium]MCI8980701.1 polysaccharide deacetylase family protein [Clostridia bacterium]
MKQKTFLIAAIIITLFIFLSVTVFSLPTKMSGNSSENTNSQSNANINENKTTESDTPQDNAQDTPEPEASSSENKPSDDSDASAEPAAKEQTPEENSDQNVSSEPEIPSAPMIALTFDDGPYSPVTDRILAKLAEYNGKATFFVVGNRVSTYPNSVINASNLGCEIGNHTWDHTPLTKLSPLEIAREIHDTDTAVGYYTGKFPALVRPVGGGRNEVVDASVDKPMINWSVDTKDWNSKNSQKVIWSVLNNVQDGDIVLMHDLYPSTADACDVLIPELIGRGYQLVTVSELASAKGITPEPGKLYRSFRP